MTATQTVAAVVRYELGKRGLSQADLARVLGESEASVSRKLSGARSWKMAELDELSEWLGVPLPVLLMAPVGLATVQYLRPSIPDTCKYPVTITPLMPFLATAA